MTADVSADGGSCQRLWRISSLSASPRIDRALAAQRGAHGEEVGGRGDVVDAQDLRARVDAVADRGERPRPPLARRAAGQRADEVLARDGQQQRPAERVQLLEAAEQLDRLRRRLGEVRPRIEDELLLAHAARARERRSAREERDDVGDDVVVVDAGSCRRCLGAARVCMSTSAAPVAAQTSASSGSRSPLTSLTITAPAAIAAAATAGLYVSTETTAPSSPASRVDQRHDALDLLLDRRPRGAA